MKQQLMIAAIACAVSSAAFAAATGSHTITLTVDPSIPTSTFDITGSLVGDPIEGQLIASGSNQFNWSELTSAAGVLVYEQLGTIGIVAHHQPTGQNLYCRITATGDWTLSATNAPDLKYGLKEHGQATIIFGHEDATDTVFGGEIAELVDGTGECDVSKMLDLVLVADTTKPEVTSSTDYQDIITFNVAVN